MSKFAAKEYTQTNEWLEVDGVKKLRVSMETKEFGVMYSPVVDQVKDSNINHQLLNTLGEDLITEYERNLSQRPTVVRGWR